MTLDIVLSIAQIVGILAVVASVIFLALETRTANRSHRLNAYAHAVNLMQTATRDLKRDPELMSIYSRGLADFQGLTKEDQWRYGAMMQEYMWAFHALYAWDETNMNSDSAYTVEGTFDMPNMRAIILRPGFIDWWQAGQHTLPLTFATFVNGMMELNLHHAAPNLAREHEKRDEAAE